MVVAAIAIVSSKVPPRARATEACVCGEGPKGCCNPDDAECTVSCEAGIREGSNKFVSRIIHNSCSSNGDNVRRVSAMCGLVDEHV